MMNIKSSNNKSGKFIKYFTIILFICLFYKLIFFIFTGNIRLSFPHRFGGYLLKTPSNKMLISFNMVFGINVNEIPIRIDHIKIYDLSGDKIKIKHKFYLNRREIIEELTNNNIAISVSFNNDKPKKGKIRDEKPFYSKTLDDVIRVNLFPVWYYPWEFYMVDYPDEPFQIDHDIGWVYSLDSERYLVSGMFSNKKSPDEFDFKNPLKDNYFKFISREYYEILESTSCEIKIKDKLYPRKFWEFLYWSSQIRVLDKINKKLFYIFLPNYKFYNFTIIEELLFLESEYFNSVDNVQNEKEVRIYNLNSKQEIYKTEDIGLDDIKKRIRKKGKRLFILEFDKVKIIDLNIDQTREIKLNFRINDLNEVSKPWVDLQGNFYFSENGDLVYYNGEWQRRKIEGFYIVRVVRDHENLIILSKAGELLRLGKDYQVEKIILKNIHQIFEFQEKAYFILNDMSLYKLEKETAVKVGQLNGFNNKYEIKIFNNSRYMILYPDYLTDKPLTEYLIFNEKLYRFDNKYFLILHDFY